MLFIIFTCHKMQVVTDWMHTVWQSRNSHILYLCLLCIQLIMSRNKHSDEQHLEFGGVIGATLLVIILPATVMAINIACNKVFITLQSVKFIQLKIVNWSDVLHMDVNICNHFLQGLLCRMGVQNFCDSQSVFCFIQYLALFWKQDKICSGYNGRWTDSHMQSIEWHRFQWAWMTSNTDFKITT